MRVLTTPRGRPHADPHSARWWIAIVSHPRSLPRVVNVRDVVRPLLVEQHAHQLVRPDTAASQNQLVVIGRPQVVLQRVRRVLGKLQTDEGRCAAIGDAGERKVVEGLFRTTLVAANPRIADRYVVAFGEECREDITSR